MEDVTTLGVFVSIVVGFVISLFLLIPFALFIRRAEDRDAEEELELTMFEIEKASKDRTQFVLEIMDELHIPHANGDDICISCGNPNCPYVLAERPYLACACWQPKGE